MSTDGKVRVGVLAVDPLRLLGLQTILQEDSWMEVVECSTGSMANGELAAILVDGTAFADRLVDVVARVRRERPDTKVLVVGRDFDAEQVQELIRAGAKGYLPESANESEVRTAIKVVLEGSIWAPRKLLARLIDAAHAPADEGPLKQERLSDIITPREREVLHLLMEGKSNRDIAHALAIDEVTVKAHLGRMLRKAGASNRVELTLRAIEELGEGPLHRRPF